MKKLSKSGAKEKIDEFFERERFKPEEAKKIKRLGMKFKIKLGDKKKRFCKKCFSDLRDGKVRIDKGYKIVECKCGYKNNWRLR